MVREWIRDHRDSITPEDFSVADEYLHELSAARCGRRY